jgi:hypothetical protein
MARHSPTVSCFISLSSGHRARFSQIAIPPAHTEMATQFAWVVQLAPTVELISTISQRCESFEQNRQVHHGRPSCVLTRVSDMLHSNYAIGATAWDWSSTIGRLRMKTFPPSSSPSICTCGRPNLIRSDLNLDRRSLRKISAKMDGWLQLNRVQGFLRQAEIAKDIERCHRMLTDCWGSVQVGVLL